MSIHAQETQSVDLQTLEDKLQRLEQEMQDLKNEISPVEQMQQTAIAARAVSSRTPPPLPPAEKEKASPEHEESHL